MKPARPQRQRRVQIRRCSSESTSPSSIVVRAPRDEAATTSLRSSSASLPQRRSSMAGSSRRRCGEERPPLGSSSRDTRLVAGGMEGRGQGRRDEVRAIGLLPAAGHSLICATGTSSRPAGGTTEAELLPARGQESPSVAGGAAEQRPAFGDGDKLPATSPRRPLASLLPPRPSPSPSLFLLMAREERRRA
jgi:hypothetical protein